MSEPEPFLVAESASDDRPGSEPLGARVDLDELYRQDYPRLVAVAHGLTGRRAVAEELVQDAFVRAHQRWDRVAELDQPSAWLRRVVINLATSRARRLVVEARYLAGLRPDNEPPVEAETAEFWRLVRRLPPRQRVVVALYYADDLDTATIAEVLGRAPGTVRAQLHSARQRLALEINGHANGSDHEHADVFSPGDRPVPSRDRTSTDHHARPTPGSTNQRGQTP